MGENKVSVLLLLVCLWQTHVETYEIVRPQRLHWRHKRSLQDTQPYPDTVQYELAIEGKNHTIHLEKNRNLISSGFTETHYTEDGKRVTTSPNEDVCFYHGRVQGVSDSAVSVGICSGISGFLRVQQQVYVIEPLADSDEGKHAVYRHEHLKASCGSNNTSTMYDQDQGPKISALFKSRAWKSKPERSVLDEERFVELYVVADYAEYKKYGSRTKSRIIGAVNHIDKLYRPLNIRVVLVGLEVWSSGDQISVDRNSETTLDNFLLWRQRDLLKREEHDNAQFVTGTDFEGDTVGLANKFAMCTPNSGGVNQDHHSNALGLASTIAHEMGHNVGLSHDEDECRCGNNGAASCVMADKLRTENQAFPELFSDCSVEQLSDFLQRARPGCLSRPGGLGGPGARCGNALLEPGEECDCGTAEECKNPCCDASTCRLTPGSQCAHGRCCDGCQFRLAGWVCRASAGDCDLPDYCSGAAADCPDDGFRMNGAPCYNQGEGFCHDGRCPTLQHHCWRLFGPGARVAPDVCFNLNKQGDKGVNCGRNRYGFTPCTAANIKCGTIFCGGGGESITGKRAGYKMSNMECKLAEDDDESRRMDMVPQGARCGVNKVCLDHRCVDVSVYGKRGDCAKKCNNNGVCNHKLECHCDPGWAPPYCQVQYADLPQDRTAVIAGVCAAVSFLVIVTALTAGLMCCRKDNMDAYVSKRKVHSAPDGLNPVIQSAKGRPQISSPTFMESTASFPLVPVSPSRAPPKLAGERESKAEWEEDLGEEILEDLWDAVLRRVHSSSICSKLDRIQSKILHRTITTRIMLQQYRKDIDPTCIRCHQALATHAHMLWSCPSLRDFWTQIFRSISVCTKVEIDPTALTAVFGVLPPTLQLPEHKADFVAYVTLFARHVIILTWRAPRSPSHGSWVINVLRFVKVEEVRCSTDGSLAKFNQIWGPFFAHVEELNNPAFSNVTF